MPGFFKVLPRWIYLSILLAQLTLIYRPTGLVLKYTWLILMCIPPPSPWPNLSTRIGVLGTVHLVSNMFLVQSDCPHSAKQL